MCTACCCCCCCCCCCERASEAALCISSVSTLSDVCDGQKMQNELTDWNWRWVFWPYFMLATICLGIAAWATCRMFGTSDADVLKQSSVLRVYNLGFFLLVTLPLTGACYLDGLLSEEAAYVPPVNDSEATPTQPRAGILAFCANHDACLTPACLVWSFAPPAMDDTGIGGGSSYRALSHAHLPAVFRGRQ